MPFQKFLRGFSNTTSFQNLADDSSHYTSLNPGWFHLSSDSDPKIDKVLYKYSIFVNSSAETDVWFKLGSDYASHIYLHYFVADQDLGYFTWPKSMEELMMMSDSYELDRKVGNQYLSVFRFNLTTPIVLKGGRNDSIRCRLTEPMDHLVSAEVLFHGTITSPTITI